MSNIDDKIFAEMLDFTAIRIGGAANKLQPITPQSQDAGLNRKTRRANNSDRRRKHPKFGKKD